MDFGSRGLGPKSTQNPALESKGAPKWFTYKMAHDRSTVKRCLAALVLLEMSEEEGDRVTKRGKTRQWIKRRGDMIDLAKYIP